MATNSKTVKTAATLVKASKRAYTRKWSFLAMFVLVLFISVSTAASLDVLPDPEKSASADVTASMQIAAPIVAISSPEEPTKIEIPTIGLSTTVSNPNSTNVAVLDNALLKGAVRYPSSSNLGEQGNVIIFAHSSYLPIVNNQAFKAFNGIQKLKEGDRIMVTGSGHQYVYAVEMVKQESTTEDAIPLTVDGAKLTLATCDSFGQKSDRFVVTATLVELDAIAINGSNGVKISS